MPRKTTSTKPRSRKAANETPAAKAVDALRGAPRAAEEQVQKLIATSRPAIARAQAIATEASMNLKEQAMALREGLATRASGLGSRVEKERKNIGKRVDGAVRATLASLNIPTRSEINLLTKRVEELSKKIDRLKRK